MDTLFTFALNNLDMILSRDTIVSTLDKDTGEMIDTVVVKQCTVKIKQDQFYMIYFEQLSSFYKLTSIKEVFVLSKLCSLAAWDTGEVIISSITRNSIMSDLNVEKTYLSSCIKRLCEKGLISKIAINHYLINPNCFWKGSNKTRNELIRTKKLSLNINFELDTNGTNS